MVHQGDVGRVIQAGAFRDQAHLEQDAFGILMPTLGQKHLVALFIQGEITHLGNAFARMRIGFALSLIHI